MGQSAQTHRLSVNQGPEMNEATTLQNRAMQFMGMSQAKEAKPVALKSIALREKLEVYICLGAEC